MNHCDHTATLQTAVAQALDKQTPLHLRAGGSKDFYGRPVSGELLDISGHSGIINYTPSELVITARAGTPLVELEKTLDEHHQLLPFEPPHFGPGATLGGTIACGLSGSRRPWGGAARDLVLGMHIINGRGEVLRFGGEVMKNVAGYDVSRLMTGALGTLGVILDVSIKVLPKPETEITLALAMNAQAAIDTIADIGLTPCPLSAAAYCDKHLWLRLSGAHAGVSAARQKLGGDLQDNSLWQQLREHTLAFFTQGEGQIEDKGDLWRLSLPPATPVIADLGEQLIDWGGAQRWFFSRDNAASIRAIAEKHAAHAVCFRRAKDSPVQAVFHPLNSIQQRLNRAVKHAFDPQGIFNPGRMYAQDAE